MKTFNLKSAKCFGILMLLFLSSFTTSAIEQIEWQIHDGFAYEITYDSETPWEGTAALICREDLFYNDSSIDSRIKYPDTDSIWCIPSMIGLYPVTTICGGISGYDDLKVVVVPSTVTKIQNAPFSASNIESIYFLGNENENTPITFDRRAFKGCKRLTSVNFYRPLNQVVPEMFENCTKLKDVYFNDVNSSMDSIGDRAFFKCASLTYITIPNSIKYIGQGAFAHCNNLKAINHLTIVNLPSGVTTINDLAFAECHQITKFNLPSLLQYIGKAAFLNCWSLTSMSIPDEITTINDFTFYDCHNLTDININNVTTLGERSFAGCNKLTSIDLTNTPDIGEEAFFGGKVTWGVNDLCELGWNYEELLNLGSLKKITLSNAMKDIYPLTFSGHVPDTITCMAPAPPVFCQTSIFDKAFSDSAYMTSVLVVPLVLVNDYREAFDWSRFVHIEGVQIRGNGDVNGDGIVNISDVTTLISSLLGCSNLNTFNPINANVNGDGILNISDVTHLISMILKKQTYLE